MTSRMALCHAVPSRSATAIDRGGRRSRLITETGHDDDHPIGFPEGTYLNAVLAELD